MALIFFIIPGLLVFAGAAWLWRKRVGRRKVHWLIALLFAAMSWFGNWLLGLWLYLDVLHAGIAGDVAGMGIWSSLVPAIAVFRVLNKGGLLTPESQ